MYNLNIFKRLLIVFFKSKAKQLFYKNALKKVTPPNLYPALSDKTIHFRHSGLLGDIIYSIPAMLALAEGRSIQLHLNIDQPTSYKKNMKHYNKNKMLTEKTIELLAPLLLSQPGFEVCDIYSSQRIDYNLDVFRKYPFNYDAGNISRYYFYSYGISRDLSIPWLTAPADLRYKDSIVIARSFRYRAPCISYGFLNQYTDIVFVGLKEEFEDLKTQLPGLKFQPTNNFYDLARIIAGCKFFIGNQSFPFALAEGLKVKRVLELYFECPNVIPAGEHAYDFCYQEQFEKIVKQLS